MEGYVWLKTQVGEGLKEVQRWAEVRAGKLVLYPCPPVQVVSLRGQRVEEVGANSLLLPGAAEIRLGTAADRRGWAAALSAAAAQRDEYSAELRQRELALRWREHRVAVAEELARRVIPPPSPSSDAGSAAWERDEAIAPEELQAAKDGLRNLQERLRAGLGLSQGRASSTRSGTVGTMDCDEQEEQVDVETAGPRVLDLDETPVSPRRKVEFAVPRPGEGRADWWSLQAAPAAGGVAVSINGDERGVLVKLSYDPMAHWLNTQTAQGRRSGLRLPAGSDGAALLSRLADVADVAGMQHDLRQLREGGWVSTTCPIRFASGRSLDPGERCEVVAIPGTRKGEAALVRSCSGILFGLREGQWVGAYSGDGSESESEGEGCYSSDSQEEEEETEPYDTPGGPRLQAPLASPAPLGAAAELSAAALDAELDDILRFAGGT
eukprot:TRINITY_DN1847_c0_g1_i1.p1 TRINITY_DN1847_c0_g1~~TRINITY_DN1847_c0_g1_i1.p1  ORF type:complete len:437 (+),score=123.40 TRINITY_DN1847_c0_g1_i1:99-1409(+)